MPLATFVIGAFLAGWVLPELVLAHGARSDIRRIPAALNLLTAIAASLIAYGLRA